MTEILENWLSSHILAINRTFNSEKIEHLFHVAEKIAEKLKAGGKIVIFGNGGSAADSQHIAAEFVSRLKRDRKPLAAIALTTDTSALTAIGNDYGFENIFSRQLQAVSSPEDVVIAITTSGRSLNVLEALQVAMDRGILSILFTGESVPKNTSLLANYQLNVASSETAIIQEVHIMFGHMLCAQVEVLLNEV